MTQAELALVKLLDLAHAEDEARFLRALMVDEPLPRGITVTHPTPLRDGTRWSHMHAVYHWNRPYALAGWSPPYGSLEHELSIEAQEILFEAMVRRVGWAIQDGLQMFSGQAPGKEET